METDQAGDGEGELSRSVLMSEEVSFRVVGGGLSDLHGVLRRAACSDLIRNIVAAGSLCCRAPAGGENERRWVDT